MGSGRWVWRGLRLVEASRPLSYSAAKYVRGRRNPRQLRADRVVTARDDIFLVHNSRNGRWGSVVEMLMRPSC